MLQSQVADPFPLVHAKLAKFREEIRRSQINTFMAIKRAELLGEGPGIGVMEATKIARECGEIIRRSSPKAIKEDLDSLEFNMEEMLQTGELTPEEARNIAKHSLEPPPDWNDRGTPT